ERRVDYGPIDPAAAREVFIRDALASDRVGATLEFLEHNRRVRDELLEWEARRRTRDLFVGAPGVARFYAERLPPDVRDRASLERWCRSGEHAARLFMRATDIATRDPAELPEQDYPAALEVAGQRLPLVYRFEPGREDDGITLELPQTLLGSVRPEELDWLVPGWLAEKATALLRTLPKEQRRPLVPLPDTVAALLPALERRRGLEPLPIALAAAAAERGIAIDPAALAVHSLPDHLRMRIEVVAADGRVLGAGRDLLELERRFGGGPHSAKPRGGAA